MVKLLISNITKTTYGTKNMKPHKYAQTQKTIQPWIEQHPIIQNYLQRLNANRTRVAVYLWQYCEYANKTPEELLALKNDYNNVEAEQLLDKFIIAKSELPDCTKSNIINAVKGFYRVNYKQLQAQAGKFEYTPKKNKTITPKDKLIKIFEACYSPRDKALIMLGTSTSMARETLAGIQWNHLEEDWEKQEIPCIKIPSNIIKGKGKGKYRGTQQITFLTPETKRILTEYRNWYAKTFQHNWKPDDHILLSIKDNIHEPLAKEGLSRALTIITNRAKIKYGVHQGRTRLQTIFENNGVNPNWIQTIKGRKVRGEQAPYSKPTIEQMRQKFREALPEIEFLIKTDETKIKTMENKYKAKDKKRQTEVQALTTKLNLLMDMLSKNGIMTIPIYDKTPEQGKEGTTPPDEIKLYQPKKSKTKEENIKEMLKLIPKGKTAGITN
jgi:hypothetical protein